MSLVLDITDRPIECVEARGVKPVDEIRWTVQDHVSMVVQTVSPMGHCVNVSGAEGKDEAGNIPLIRDVEGAAYAASRNITANNLSKINDGLVFKTSDGCTVLGYEASYVKVSESLVNGGTVKLEVGVFDSADKKILMIFSAGRSNVLAYASVVIVENGCPARQMIWPGKNIGRKNVRNLHRLVHDMMISTSILS